MAGTRSPTGSSGPGSDLNRPVLGVVHPTAGAHRGWVPRTGMMRMRTTTRIRRSVVSAVAVLGMALPGLAMLGSSSQAEPGERHSQATVPAGVGAFSGVVDGVRAPFDGDIRNNTLAVSPDERVAVVTNSGSDRLIVIDLRTGRQIRQISGYTTPRSILFAPDGKSFTVSDSTLGVIDTISTRTYRVQARLPLGAGVFGTAQTGDGAVLYANNQAAGTVTVVDQAARRPVAVITGFAQPRQGVQLSPAEDTLYVTNFQGDRITKVDTATHERIAEISGFVQVRGLSISEDGTRLYAANSGDDTVSIVDTVSGATLRKVPVGRQPYGAKLSPDETVVLSGNLAGNSLTAFNPGTGEIIGTVHGVVGPRQAISFSHDSSTAWVLNEDLSIAEVDVDDLTVTRTLGRR